MLSKVKQLFCKHKWKETEHEIYHRFICDKCDLAKNIDTMTLGIWTHTQRKRGRTVEFMRVINDV